MIVKNPILPGFNPDPCICRKGDDYYIAVSTFEYLPGIPIYHSKDLAHWELYTHVLKGKDAPDLTRLPSSKAIWAPCLTYCESEDLFYVVYGVMNSMNARYFDIDNFLITAKDIRGPWSEPVYLHSSGFDASILHDDDGRKWIVALDWETRANYEKPGAICLAEYDPREKRILGYPRRIWRGGTDRGCIEAPHLTKHDGRYYIMCAEGGTGYYHSVTVGRADHVEGPYEPDPTNPIITSQPAEANERADWDHLKPHYYNPHSRLQKSGHGSYVETPEGDVYLVHLTSRPFVPEKRCTLGRETAIQKMRWTEDGWLRKADGNAMAADYVETPDLPEFAPKMLPERYDFNAPGDWEAQLRPEQEEGAILPFGGWEMKPEDAEQMLMGLYSPRILPETFVDLESRPGYAGLRGGESFSSLNKASLLLRKLTSVYATITCKMDFHPEVHQHSAGLILYYDNMNWAYLRKYHSDALGGSALSVIRLENGEKTEIPDTRIRVDERELYLRLEIKGRASQFYWSFDGKSYEKIGGPFDTSKFSDEYCKYGEFTGTMVGLGCADRVFHRQVAWFDFLEYVADESREVE